MQGKENDDEADYDARIESHRGKIIESHPPAEVETPHEPLEDGTRQGPRYKVYAVDRWDAARRDQRNRDIHVAPKRARATTSEVVEGDGQEYTNQEEPDEWIIAKAVRQSVIAIIRSMKVLTGFHGRKVAVGQFHPR